jgi:Uma2 family endonuclease
MATQPHLDLSDYLALQAEAGWTLPVELIAGEAVVIPPSGGRASSAQGEVFYALRRWQEMAGDDGLLLQNAFVAFPDYAAPDIAWWPKDRRPVVGERAVDVVPDLVVEVLSSKTRDYGLRVKRRVYVRAGVRELWLVDPDAETLTCVFADGRETLRRAGNRFTSDLLDGFAIQLADIFVV